MRKSTQIFVGKLVDKVMSRLESIIIAAIVGAIYAIIVGGCNHLNNNDLKQEVKVLQDNADQ